MATNRLAISIEAEGAEEGLRKLRLVKSEMRDVAGAATKAERGVDELGDELTQTGRKADQYGRSVGGAKRQTDALASAAAAGVSRLAAIGAAAAGAGASLAVIGSFRAASAFESEFSKIETLLDSASFKTGALNDNIAGLKTGLLELRSNSGDTFDNLTKGMFDLVSAGVDASDSIRVLNDANVLAKAGVTDVAVSVDGLTTVINAYGEASGRSEVLASKFFTAQKFGKTTVEELARGLGQVAPLAAQLGVSLDELFASQAAATSAGIRQSEAFTGLKATLTNIVKPSKDAADEAARLGVSFDAAGLKAKGLTKFLADIKSSANVTDESFQKLFGSAEALNFVLAVTGGGAAIYAKTLSELGDEAKSVATLQEAYARVLDDSGQKIGRLQGTVEALAVAVGAGLAPAFNAATDKLTKFLSGDDFAARLEGITSGVSDTIKALVDNWDIVEKTITAAATALTVYLAIQIASHLASILNLAKAWASVSAAIRAAAASQALLTGANLAAGGSGLTAGLRGIAGLATILSGAALRGGLAALARVVSLFGGPVAFGIVTAVTAIVTFRKEIGAAAKEAASWASNLIAGTRDAGIGLNALFSVIGDRLEGLKKRFSEGLTDAAEWVIAIRAEGAEAVERVIDRIKSAINDARDKFSALIPPGVKGAATELSSTIGDVLAMIRAVADEAGKMASAIVSAFDAAAKKIREGFADAIEWIAGRITDFARVLASTPLGVKLKTDAEDLQNFLRDVRAEAAQQEINIKAKVQFDQGLKNFKDQFGDAPIGVFIDPSVDAAKTAFVGLSNEVKNYVEIAGQAKTASAGIFSGVGESAKTVEQALREQVALAQRLSDAARGGQDNFDAAKKAIELDAIAASAVERAAEAGEKLTFETARFLVGNIDSLNDAADAILDAEKRLKEGIAKTRDSIFQSLSERVDSFASDVTRVNLKYYSAFDAERIAEDFGLRLAQILQDVEIDSVGIIDAEQLGELERKVKELTPLFYAALKNGGLRVSQDITQALDAGSDDLADKIGVSISRVVGEVANVVDGIFGTANRLVDIIGDKSLKTIEKVTAVMRTLGDKAQRFGENLGGPVGDVIKAGGTILKAVSSVIDLVKNIFSKPSNEAAAVNFKLDTGTVVDAFSKNNNAENIAARDALKDATIGITQALKELTGGNFGGSGIVINVGKRENVITSAGQSIRTPAGDNEAALQAVITLLLKNLRGGESALVSFAKQAFASGQSIEDVISVLEVLKQASDTGQKALSDYALAMATAGRSAGTIAKNVNALAAISALAEPKLSDVAAALKQISDAIDPVKADLKEIGQPTAGIDEIEKQAVRSVGVNFIQGIQEEIDSLQNSTLAEFKSLLKKQAQDISDANQLLSRGGITQDEFRLVQQRNALAQKTFFENLDQDKLNELGDYLGLVRENGGEAAVVLLQFNQELDRTKERLTSGLSEMRKEADRFFAAATANFNLASDIRSRLSNETGTVQLATFRGELQGLLAQVKGPDQEAAINAAERAPEVGRQFIELAERQFGASAGLGQARDFVTDILDQIGAAAKGFGNETLDAIALAEQQIDVLNRISDTLASPDPAIDVLQSILNNGEIQSATLRDLLDQYVQLSYGSPAQSYTPGQVQQAATEIVIPSDLKITNTVTTDAPGVTLAINQAAGKANENAEAVIDALRENKRALDEMQLAIRKLDGAIRLQN